MAALKATLTLPGIAGMILIIGMSIDANVIIFERIREELAKERAPRSAVDAGYKKALRTILDANITTLIVALILFQFGSGPLRGFATTLSIGILASLFTSIVVTRIIFNLLIAGRPRKKMSI
jgi:preprotein translocase subunit SecD